MVIHGIRMWQEEEDYDQQDVNAADPQPHVACVSVHISVSLHRYLVND